MILSDSEIHALGPDLVRPFSPELVNPASLDVRIGKAAIVFHHNPAADATARMLGRTREPRHYDLTAKHVRLRRGDFALFELLEEVNLPVGLAANLYLKSSRARAGLDHALAMWCDPGWRGRLTAEVVVNHPWEPFDLVYGQPFGQLVFHRMSQPPAACYQQTGRYVGDRAKGVQRAVS